MQQFLFLTLKKKTFDTLINNKQESLLLKEKELLNKITLRKHYGTSIA
jgi:hypothetical protein